MGKRKRTTSTHDGLGVELRHRARDARTIAVGVRCVLVAGTLLSVVGASVGVRAEVRLLPSDAARVAVRSTPAGPWTALGVPTPADLNVAGDVLGDGHPGIATRGSTAVAAWIRPADGTVRVAFGLDGNWRHAPPLEDAAAVGTPRVLLLDDAVIVAWRREPGLSDATRVALVPNGGGPVLELADERQLIDAAAVGRSLHLILFDAPTASIEDRMVVLSPIIDPPIDINDHTDVQLGVLGWVPSSDAVLSSVDPATTTGPEPAGSTALLESNPRVHDVQRGGERIAVLSWWSGVRELSYVELSEDGPAGSVRRLKTDAGPVRPPSLIQQAIWDVRGNR